MIKTLKLFFRDLKNHRSISTINIVGLVLGMLSALFILEYVSSEKSYDKYHEKAYQVYRVAYNRYKNNALLWETANSFYPTGKWMKENFDEVEDYAVIQRKYNITVTHIDKANTKVFFFEPKTYSATSSIFNLFTIPLLQGNKDCIVAPNTVAISADAAKKYFGQSDPIGQKLIVNNDQLFTVTAIFKPIPNNSHLKTNFLFSLSTITTVRQNLLNNWDYDYFSTYLQLSSSTNFKEFEQNAFKKMIADNYGESLKGSNSEDKYYLQPLPTIHLQSNIEYETETPGNSKGVNILFGFSMFLMIVAWINYINLATARSVDRAREIGIRKISGAKKMGLFWQFISESFLFNLICFVIAFILFIAINPFFKNLAQITDFNLFDVPELLFYSIAFFLFGIIMSGIYPALIIASFKPIKVLKGQFKNTSQGIGIRKGLLVIQFTISIVLLVGAIVTYKQAKLLMEKDMGVDYNRSLVIRAPRLNNSSSDFQQKMDLFKNKLLQLPQVKDYTFTSDVPGQEMESWFYCYKKGNPPTDGLAHFQLAVDYRFIAFYDIKLLAGRAYYENENAEQGSIIVNESAMRRIGCDTPESIIGKQVTNGRRDFTVVGVTKDYHFKSIKIATVPIIMTLNSRQKAYVTIKLNPQHWGLATVIDELKEQYNTIFPDQPFEFFTLDDKMRIDLKPDRTFAVVFGFFSILGIIIASIGIFGLMLITANQNMKEMGVRKVLGARQLNISWLLSKNVIIQFAIALLIAVPFSYFGYQKWFIENYIYRIKQEWWLYAVPTVMFSIIILAVVYISALKVSKTNPAETLKCE